MINYHRVDGDTLHPDVVVRAGPSGITLPSLIEGPYPVKQALSTTKEIMSINLFFYLKVDFLGTQKINSFGL